ncbi:TPA: hypothetical protein ACE8FG_001790 [Neisseria gonorrhoeae]
MSDTPATRDFGLIDGRAVTGYVLSNRRGTCVFVLDLGGIVQEFSVLADGVRENPVVSFDDAASYADNPFQINKQIGRVAGRIRGAAFDINGRTYRVPSDIGRPAAVLQAGRRRRISIYSDRNGLVIFTAAPQDFARHDAGVYDALATEAQTLPDSLHWPEFGNIRLNKGDTREATIAYGIESLS